jgi:hypothetical protein
LKVLKRDEKTKTKNVNKHTKKCKHSEENLLLKSFCNANTTSFSSQKKPTAFFLPINKNKTTHPKTTFKWPQKIILTSSNLL